MHLVLDICQGIGVAAAVGIRPFVPALLVGVLAAGDVQIDFAGTSMHFLQEGPFLLAMLVCAIVLAILEWRLSPEAMERGPIAILVALASLAIGALLFAGALCQDGYKIWPGLIAGAVCAAVGVLATRPLLARVRQRLDEDAGGILAVFAEIAAVIAAVFSVLAPPVGPVILALLIWLLIAGRGRGDQKYAGLRILR